MQMGEFEMIQKLRGLVFRFLTYCVAIDDAWDRACMPQGMRAARRDAVRGTASNGRNSLPIKGYRAFG